MTISTFLKITILTILSTFSLYSAAQVCSPDPQYANSPTGTYPLPDNTNGADPTLGIYDNACVNQYFEFPITVVLEDSLSFSGINLDIENFEVSSVDGLPSGMTYNCSPPSCNFEDMASGCILLYGTPTSTGDFLITITGTMYFNSNIIPQITIVLPDDNIADGEYRLTVENNCSPTIPVANFSATNTNGCAPLTVNYTNLSANSTAWSWSFPGGTPSSSTQQNPSVTYNTAGSFDVSLTATNGANMDTKTLSNLVNITSGTTPAPSFTHTTNALIAFFTNTSTNAQSYSWDFGDGNSSTQLSPNHTYSAAGSYTVVLTATGPCGSETFSQVVTVGQVPIANFTSSTTSGCVPHTVTYQDQTLNNPTSWVWSFPGGNPASSTVQNPTVSYIAEGDYDVSLTVSNALGSDSDSKTNYVQTTDLPEASFTYTVNGGTVSFVNTSVGGTSYVWTFGDGGFSNQINPTYAYSTSSSYVVMLTTSNSCGEVSSMQTVTVVVSGINNLSEAGLSLFPNPSNGKIYLQGQVLSTQKVEWSLFNVTGKLLQESTYLIGNNTISEEINIEAPGVYFARIKMNDKIFNQKIIVH